MPYSIIVNSIMGRRLTEQDVIVCFVRINAFHANIYVNDTNNCFGFSKKIDSKKIFESFVLLTSISHCENKLISNGMIMRSTLY